MSDRLPGHEFDRRPEWFCVAIEALTDAMRQQDVMTMRSYIGRAYVELITADIPPAPSERGPEPPTPGAQSIIDYLEAALTRTQHALWQTQMERDRLLIMFTEARALVPVDRRPPAHTPAALPPKETP